MEALFIQMVNRIQFLYAGTSIRCNEVFIFNPLVRDCLKITSKTQAPPANPDPNN